MKQDAMRISLPQALKMIRGYAAGKIFEQAASVAFIAIYMAAFQVLILGVPIAGAAGIGAGMFFVVMGLAFFIEGLVLGIMPIGEQCGLRLPQSVPLPVLLLFAFAIGVAATIAEPAVGILKILGSQVDAWEAPLLFMMLNGGSGELVIAIAVGVGIAMFFGILRYVYHISLKPILYIIIPILLAVSTAAHFDPKVSGIISLAWDAGGVTTGPVTVPLIMALGIGISRSLGGEDKGMTGFGMVTLASAFPILTVLIYGFMAAPNLPLPAEKADFFAPDRKASVLRLFPGESEMNRYASRHLDAESALLFIGGEAEKTQSGEPAAEVSAAKRSGTSILISKIQEAAISILPLSFFLFLVLLALNKGKIRNKDQILLGILFSVIGMAAFGFGIDAGLAKLGDETGRNLPAAYKAVPAPDKAVTIRNFDETLIRTAVREDGSREKYFLFSDDGKLRFLPYNEDHLDRANGAYLHTPARGPIFGGRLGGYAALLAFAFLMGFGATLAEPALRTLGSAVEEVSVGTFKRSSLVNSVAVGVGIGMIVGFLKILYEIPVVYLLVPCYLLLLVITALSPEDFTNIAWDSSGVTTGPITVPLVISMGLGIGGEVGVVDGFGICAISSLFAILFVMGTGLIVSMRRRAALKE